MTNNIPRVFTGGALETNFFLIACPEGNLLIDAPEGAAASLQDTPISLLILTHGHFDHVWDAAEIARIHECPVAMHPTTQEMLADRNLLRRFGLNLEVEPVVANFFLHEEREKKLLGKVFDIFEVPGHCPGSLCFYDKQADNLFGGDVLFSGGIGRWDLPGGDRELLINGIHTKLFPLPSATSVYPGHGPTTTIGIEKRCNPYLQII